MKIISLSGKKKSGKNTVATIIQELSSEWCVEVAYADALKGEVATACSCSVKHINENKDIFRPILQWWGADFRRNFEGHNYWVYRLDNTLSKLLASNRYGVIIITDCRFPNELQYAKSVEAYTVNVKRLSPDPDMDFHSSEISLDGFAFDHVIHNDGSLDDLRHKVKGMLTSLEIKIKL